MFASLQKTWHSLASRLVLRRTFSSLAPQTARNNEPEDISLHVFDGQRADRDNSSEGVRPEWNEEKVTRLSQFLKVWSRFRSRRYNKLLRFLRMAAVALVFMGGFFEYSSSSSYWVYYIWQTLGVSTLWAWDIYRALHSLYQRVPGYSLEIFFAIETSIAVATLVDVAYFAAKFTSPKNHGLGALWRLPNILLSLYIAYRNASRYRSRRRERHRFLTTKPRLMFTASGKPVAMYVVHGIYNHSEIERLSVDSLQETRDPTDIRNDYDLYNARPPSIRSPI